MKEPWYKRHHVWQTLSGIVSFVAGLGAYAGPIAAVNPHAAAIVAAASGVATVAIAVHQQATKPADAQQPQP